MTYIDAIRHKKFSRILLLALGLFLAACSGKNNTTSLRDVLKLNTKSLTFVYFFTPG